jgi:phosphomannomutase
MGLLLVEMVAVMDTPLDQLVEQLLQDVGPAHYSRLDLRLSRPIAKDRVVRQLKEDAPAAIGGTAVAKVETLDGVKYLLEDESWLLIRPSGTESVLRVYAEAREEKLLKALLSHGQAVAEGNV